MIFAFIYYNLDILHNVKSPYNKYQNHANLNNHPIFCISIDYRPNNNKDI